MLQKFLLYLIIQLLSQKIVSKHVNFQYLNLSNKEIQDKIVSAFLILENND